MFLTETASGQLQLAKDDDGEYKLTQKPVSAVLTVTGEIADQECPLAYCMENGLIKVIIADTVLPFAGFVDARDSPCAEVDGITTPPTPAYESR